MDPKRWERVQAIFAQALDVPHERRELFVTEAAGGDESLAKEILDLLEEDSSAHSMLDEGAAEALTPDLAKELSMEGRTIGPYRLEKRIGQGGMGAVYLAVRQSGDFDHRVALKVIKRGMDSEEILTRFRAERQILAKLDHPNIARLLDGGITDDGLPYFTMEYVDGLPIDTYCDRHTLSVTERLELFKVVCDAVRYAQRRLVVHRDLKPGNILVTNDGTVKLLDFGIAKLLGEEDAGGPALTVTGHRVMTPGYAAPEQVKGEAVTTATDVYALGVILFELLTGQRPYPVSSTSPRELEKAILTVAPPRPSTVVLRADGTPASDRAASDTGTNPTAVGRDRGTDPSRLRKLLSGDLDNVCLMALRKEPERRYSSAEALLDDIVRFQTGRPVTARSDTLGYRVQKFVHRNRLAVGGTAAALLLLVALTVYYTASLAAERDRARREANKARQTADFLTDLFDVADPYTNLGETVTAREILDRGSERIKNELGDQPGVRASMKTVIGRVYHTLGLFDESEELLVAAVAIQDSLHEEDDADLARSVARLGQLRHSQGRYEEALELLGRAMEMQHRLFGAGSTEAASTMTWLAESHNELGHYERALQLYREANRLFELAGDEEQAAIGLNNVALVLYELARLDEAQATYEEALEVQRKVLGPMHPELATTLFNYAQFSRSQERLDVAERTIREATRIDRHLYGDEHPNIAYDLISLGSLLEGQYKLAAADSVFREALEMRIRIYGEEHSNVAATLNDIGRVARRRGDYDTAHEYHVKSLEMTKRVNPEHPIVRARLNALGRLARLRGDYDEAIDLLRESERLSVQLFGDDHVRTAETRLYLAETMALAGKTDMEAIVAMQRRNVALEEAWDPDGRGLTHQLFGLGRILRSAGHLDEAKETLHAAGERWRESLGSDHPALARVGVELARIHRSESNLDEAEKAARGATEVRRTRLGPDHPATASAELVLGLILADDGRSDEAEQLLSGVLPILGRAFDDDHPEAVECRRALAALRARPSD